MAFIEQGRDEISDSRVERNKRQKVDPQGASAEKTTRGSLIPEKEICEHPGFFAGMCMKCGQRADDNAAVPLKYIDKNLRLADSEIARLREKDSKNSLSRQKLHLDHTLLNSSQLTDIGDDEAYLITGTDAMPDKLKSSLFRVDKVQMMTKLRPFVHEFLEEASKLFEMYIYTMGTRSYALEMATLLDPQNKYFDSRIIARGDCLKKNQKSLDIVLGHESTVLILDDTQEARNLNSDPFGVVFSEVCVESVTFISFRYGKRIRNNLILMDRYHFFASSCKSFGLGCNSLSQLKTDESETEGALATILKVLRRVHGSFFDKERKDNIEDRDVRRILKTVQEEVLKGCKIVFSPTNRPLQRMAEQLGAKCSTEMDPSVTHVVSGDPDKDKSKRAVEEKKFLVNPGCIEASNFSWSRQPEDKFTCISY